MWLERGRVKWIEEKRLGRDDNDKGVNVEIASLSIESRGWCTRWTRNLQLVCSSPLHPATQRARLTPNVKTLGRICRRRGNEGNDAGILSVGNAFLLPPLNLRWTAFALVKGQKKIPRESGNFTFRMIREICTSDKIVCSIVCWKLTRLNENSSAATLIFEHGGAKHAHLHSRCKIVNFGFGNGDNKLDTWNDVIL